MSYLLWPLWFLAVCSVMTIAIAGKRKWDAYTKLAQIRPQEHVLHEENKVRVKQKAWASFPWYDWTYAGGGPLEYGWVTADVTITDERILAFCRGVPVMIVDFTVRERLPIPWLGYRRAYLMNVTKNDIRVTTDESGTPCLEVQYEARKGHGVRTRYYLRDFDVPRALFTERDTARVQA